MKIFTSLVKSYAKNHWKDSRGNRTLKPLADVELVPLWERGVDNICNSLGAHHKILLINKSLKEMTLNIKYEDLKYTYDIESKVRSKYPRTVVNSIPEPDSKGEISDLLYCLNIENEYVSDKESLFYFRYDRILEWDPKGFEKIINDPKYTGGVIIVAPDGDEKDVYVSPDEDNSVSQTNTDKNGFAIAAIYFNSVQKLRRAIEVMREEGDSSENIEAVIDYMDGLFQPYKANAMHKLDSQEKINKFISSDIWKDPVERFNRFREF